MIRTVAIGRAVMAMTTLFAAFQIAGLQATDTDEPHLLEQLLLQFHVAFLPLGESARGVFLVLPFLHGVSFYTCRIDLLTIYRRTAGRNQRGEWNRGPSP